MSKHFGFPGERINLTVTVNKVEMRSTDFGPIGDHAMTTSDGNLVFWQASTHAVWLNEGGTYNIKATIKTHDKDENGTPRTILQRVIEHYEAPRIPRVSIGLARGSVRKRK